MKTFLIFLTTMAALVALSWLIPGLSIMQNLKLFLSGFLLTGLVIGFVAAILNAFARKRRSPAKRQAGFSIIELLITVAIILVLASLAIPNYMRSRMTANATSAAAAIKSINTEAVAYSIAYPDQGYPASLAVMGGPAPCPLPAATAACLIDEVVASGTKAGYSFVFVGDGRVPSDAYTITATPTIVGSSGQVQFCSDESGVIRSESSGAGCTSASTPIR